MPVFNYTARTLTGELQSGTLDLPSHDDVIAHLRKNRMIVVKVQQAPKQLNMAREVTLDECLRVSGERNDFLRMIGAPEPADDEKSGLAPKDRPLTGGLKR